MKCSASKVFQKIPSPLVFFLLADYTQHSVLALFAPPLNCTSIEHISNEIVGEDNGADKNTATNAAKFLEVKSSTFVAGAPTPWEMHNIDIFSCFM